jgi:hypothetical protein
LQISEITGKDILNLGGRADEGGLVASVGAVAKALQVLYIRSSHHEQLLNNLWLAHQAFHSKLRTFTTSLVTAELFDVSRLLASC